MNRRSVIVAWLRVLLPLAALAVLSTLFLLSRKPDPEAALPYAEVDAEGLARQPRVTAPSYAGMTPDGAALTLSADTLTPAGPDAGEGGTASALRLGWRSAEGLTAELTAPHAEIGPDAIRLEGGVEFSTSTGWSLAAPQVDASTDRSRVEATGGVAADAPFGEIEADTATLEQAGEGEALHHVLNFTGGVRLLYRP